MEWDTLESYECGQMIATTTGLYIATKQKTCHVWGHQCSWISTIEALGDKGKGHKIMGVWSYKGFDSVFMNHT